MMTSASRTICFSCRHKAAASATISWTAAHRFRPVSTRHRPPPSSQSTAAAGFRPGPAAAREREWPVWEVQTDPNDPARLRRRKRSIPSPNGGGHGKHPSPSMPSLIGDTVLYEKLLELGDISKPVEIFPFLREHLWPFLRENAAALPPQSRTSALEALRTVVAAKATEPTNKALPSMLHVSQVLAAIDSDAQPRVGMILDALEWITSTDDGQPAGERDGAVAALMADVLNVWRHLSILRSRFVELGDQPDWNIPPFSWYSSAPKFSRADYAKSLGYVFPDHFHRTSPGHKQDLGCALLGTVAVLKDPGIALSRALREDGRVLCERAEQVMQTVHVAYDDVRVDFERWPSIAAYVEARWPDLRRIPMDRAPVPIDNFHVRLRAAFHSSNLLEVDVIWADLEANLRMFADRRPVEEARPVLDYLLSIACSMRRLELRSRVLRFMVDTAVLPTVATYTAMIYGFKKARMASLVAWQWEQAVESGVAFDRSIWSARISGLVECGQPRPGLQALKEMMVLWERSRAAAAAAAERETKGEQQPESFPHAVRPGIESVNAAVSGLLRAGHTDAAAEVMAWASRNGIEADVITYNSLLEQALRRGEHAHAEQLLSVMRTSGIRPDIGTFAIITNFNLRRVARSGSPAEQADAVRAVFAEMRAAGVRPNNMLYADMIDALVFGPPSGPGADEAVDVVRQHMRTAGVRESPQILTMLAQREIEREPPDLRMVRDLVARREEPWLARMDAVLWERVIVVLVWADEAETWQLVDEALGVLRWLLASNRIVSLSTLREVLAALAKHKRREEAVALVRTAHEMHARQDGAVAAKYNRHRGFWALARDLGLHQGPDP